MLICARERIHIQVLLCERSDLRMPLICVLAEELVDLAHLISRLYFPLVDLYIALVD